MAGNWTAFLPEAQKWVSQRYSVLHGHPQKKAKKHRKIRLAKAHIHNALISHGVHTREQRAITRSAFRRTRSRAFR